VKASLTQKDIRRIVVRATNWVGDAVIGVPALRRLRRLFSDAEITLVVRPWAEGLFADAEFVDKLLIYDRLGPLSVFEQVREWRSARFDLAVLFQNAFEAALIPFLARVPLRVGYATDGRGWFLTHPLVVPENRNQEHEVFYYLNIVAHLESILNHERNTDSDALEASLIVSYSRQQAAAGQLLAFGARDGRLNVAICPGSINSRAKRWPAERYAQLADRLIEDHNANVLLIGSRDEAEVSTEVTQTMKHDAINLTGKTSLAEVVAMLSLADILVTNDTGPAHIAAALGRPTLVIFGPTNPLTTRPYSETAEIIRHPPDCAPCMLRDCPIDHRCMTAITVEEVLEKSLALMREGGQRKEPLQTMEHANL
jgi:heptosyltransferase-2